MVPTSVPARLACALAVAAPLGASGALAAPAGAMSADNDTLIKAIHDLCFTPRGTVDQVAKAALRTPPRAADMGVSSGPPYGREIGLMLGGGTTVTYEAASRAAPMAKCKFVSYSDDAAGLVARLRGDWSLPEPVKRPIGDNEWEAVGTATVQGRAVVVDLRYGLQDDKKSGAFTLDIVDAGTRINDALLAAIRELCLKRRGSVDHTVRFATRPPFNAADLGPLDGTPYGHRVMLPTLGRGETEIIFIGASRSAPVSKCQFKTTASYDLAGLIAQVRGALGLPQPRRDVDPRFWRVAVRSSPLGSPIDVELMYALQAHEQTDLFHLSVTR
jgi:hypothetical protein